MNVTHRRFSRVLLEGRVGSKREEGLSCMSTTQKFDQGKIADLARQIDEALADLEAKRKEKEEAVQVWNRAETKLANLRSEFTRAIDGQLDMDTLKQKPPVRYAVEKP